MTEIGGQPPLNYRLSNFASSPPANYLWLNDSSRGWSNSIVRIRVRCCVQFYDLIDAPFFFFFSLGHGRSPWEELRERGNFFSKFFCVNYFERLFERSSKTVRIDLLQKFSKKLHNPYQKRKKKTKYQGTQETPNFPKNYQKEKSK